MESRKEALAGRIHNRELAGVADFRDINWHHYTHPQLYDMVMSADPGLIRAQSGQWASLATAIQATTTGVRTMLANLFTTWQGGAADSARASSDRLDQWAKDVTERTQQIGNTLATYSETLATARHRMPPPELAWAEHGVDQGEPFPTLTGPSGDLLWDKLIDDRQPDFEKHHAAWQEAVRVMTDYGHQSQGVHDATPPRYPDGPSVGEGQAPEIPPYQKWPDPPVPIPGPPDTPADRPGGPGRDGTTPDGYTGPGAGQGYGPGGGAYGPGAGGGAEVGRGGPGGGAFGGAGPMAARGGAAGLAGARGAAGANTLPPFGSGAGSRGEDDKEHKDKYTEGLDLFDDLPPAYPPVFGA